MFSDRVGLQHQPDSKEQSMTDDMMNLRALMEKAPYADLLREMIGLPPSG
jgi:hypothetical protein